MEEQVSKSRMLQRLLDRCSFSQRLAPQRVREAYVPIRHGWLRNALERITGSGNIEEKDLADLEYISYVTGAQGVVKPVWIPRG